MRGKSARQTTPTRILDQNTSFVDHPTCFGGGEVKLWICKGRRIKTILSLMASDHPAIYPKDYVVRSMLWTRNGWVELLPSKEIERGLTSERSKQEAHHDCAVQSFMFLGA